MKAYATAPQVTGFSLVELLLATAVLGVIATILIGATDQASKVFRRTSGKIEQFSEARRAYESVTRRIAEATLNTYWDYSYTTQGTNKIPSTYVRQSELRFRSGRMSQLVPGASVHRPTHGVFFQAPAGWVDDRDRLDVLDQTLNTWGFFTELGTDEENLPSVLRGLVLPRTRFRLIELREPTEKLSVYTATGDEWFKEPLSSSDAPVRVLAENIVALVLLPRLAPQDELARGPKPVLCPQYDYDTTRTSNHVPAPYPPDAEINPKHQLPPIVQVAMVAIDEVSAARLAAAHGDEEDLGLNTDDLFIDSGVLENDPKTDDPGDGDLKKLEDRLIEKRMEYRIFNSTVAIRGAKWSKAQTN